MSRTHQYLRYLTASLEQLRMLRDYRTPVMMRYATGVLIHVSGAAGVCGAQGAQGRVLLRGMGSTVCVQVGRACCTWLRQHCRLYSMAEAPTAALRPCRCFLLPSPPILSTSVTAG